MVGGDSSFIASIVPTDKTNVVCMHACLIVYACAIV